MSAHPYHEKLARTLEYMGGLYTASDILERIADGRMQSFTWNNSWAITQIDVFPRRRVLNLVVTVGDVGDYRELNRKLMDFASMMDIDLMTTTGRRGWKPYADDRGWKVKTTSYLYQREL